MQRLGSNGRRIPKPTAIRCMYSWRTKHTASDQRPARQLLEHYEHHVRRDKNGRVPSPVTDFWLKHDLPEAATVNIVIGVSRIDQDGRKDIASDDERSGCADRSRFRWRVGRRRRGGQSRWKSAAGNHQSNCRGRRARNRVRGMKKNWSGFKITQEAETAFGNPGVYLEKFVKISVVEIQILADQHGNVVHWVSAIVPSKTF